MGFPAGLFMTLMMTTSSISRCRVVVYVPRVDTHAHTHTHTYTHNTLHLFPHKHFPLFMQGSTTILYGTETQKKKKQVSLLFFLEKTQQIDSGIYSPKSRTLSLHYKPFLIHWLVPLLKEDKIKY